MNIFDRTSTKHIYCLYFVKISRGDIARLGGTHTCKPWVYKLEGRRFAASLGYTNKAKPCSREVCSFLQQPTGELASLRVVLIHVDA